MMEDDRPIRPSQQYIRNLNQPAERVVMNQNNYLKRSSGKYLPCFSQSKLKLTHPLNQSPKNQMSKRQIYQRIKSENQALYGKQKKKKKQNQEDSTAAQTDILKKQRAKRIQLYLKSKSNNIEIYQQKIDIQEPKKPHAKTSSSTNKNKDEKQKYQRLIKQMEKERELLKKQRQQFQQQKLLLQFRKDIKNQQGIKSKKVKQLSFDKRNKQNQYYNVINKTPSNTYTKPHKSNYNSNPLLNESQNSATDKKTSFSNRKDFKIDLVESKKLIQNISQKIIQMQSNQKNNLQRNQSNDKYSKSKFQLQSLLSINTFSIQVFSNKNDQVLIHTNNKYYQQFLNRQRTLKVLSKQKQGNKQIIKYQDGSFTKNSKKYRLVQFPNGYKLTIFQNHDVKQQIPGGMVCYYSKMRDVNKISYNDNFDIYYFYKQKQIEVHYKPSGKKEILYKNGIKRTVIGANI